MFVINAPAPVSFMDVVEHSCMARSTVSRLLASLHDNGLLERMPDGAYRGGALFAAYAARFDRTEALAAAATPTLERIGEKTGETVNLGLPSGGRVVHVAQVDSDLRAGCRELGRHRCADPLSALGMVLSAFGPLELPKGSLTRCSDGVVLSEASVVEDAALIRTRGFAITHGDFELGLDAVAAPVRGQGGAVLAAIGISGPAVRMTERIEEFGRLLVREADLLSRGLAKLPARGE